MSAIAWPAELPQCLDTYSEQAQPITVRTNVDEGPAKVRRRFSLRVVKAQASVVLRIDQRNVLDSFFYVDLDGGSKRFTFTHPWLGVLKEWRFVEAPSFSNDGPMAVPTSMVWELMN